jgi:hypothetical protein
MSPPGIARRSGIRLCTIRIHIKINDLYGFPKVNAMIQSFIDFSSTPDLSNLSRIRAKSSLSPQAAISPALP